MERFFHYDANGNGYLGHQELLRVAEDLHTLFHPNAGRF